MRIMITIAVGLFILALFNYQVLQKEKILNEGEVVFIELAPVDPRSLIQGDYMRLAFAIERTVDKEKASASAKVGRIIIKKNTDNIAEYVDFLSDQKLTKDQKTLRYRKNSFRRNIIEIQPRSFFFQEGHAKFYEAAKYGIFKFRGPNDYLLTGLADADKNPIKPDPAAEPQK